MDEDKNKTAQQADETKKEQEANSANGEWNFKTANTPEQSNKPAVSREIDIEFNNHNGRQKAILIIAAIATLLILCFFPMLLLVVVPVGALLWYLSNKQKSSHKKRITAAVIKEAFVKQMQLVVYTYETEIQVNFEDNVMVPSTDVAVPGGQRKFSITIPVTADMSIDLEKMKVAYNEENRSAVITLPSSKIFRISTDMEKYKVSEDVGVLRCKMTADEQKQFLLYAQNSVKDRISERELAELANERARTYVASFAAGLGVKTADIHFK